MSFPNVKIPFVIIFKTKLLQVNNEMETNLKVEDVFIQIRDKLNKDSVKLWLPPYYTKVTGICVEELKVR